MFSCEYFEQEEEEKTHQVEYDTLVISGASTKGFAMLGAIYYLIEENILNLSDVDTYVGCSSGSMICYLLAIGYTPIEILIFLIKNKVFETFCANIMGVLNHDGIYSFNPLVEKLQTMTVEKIGHFLTLGQLKKNMGKTFICSTFNFTTNQIEYMTPDTHPDLPCIVAIRMSANLPFIFEKFKYDGSYYIDGGIWDNFPIDKVPNFGSKKIFGIYINHLLQKNDLEKMSEMEYISKLLFILCSQNTQEKVNKYMYRSNCKILGLNGNDIPYLGFNFNHVQLLDLFSSGYASAKNNFNKDNITVEKEKMS